VNRMECVAGAEIVARFGQHPDVGAEGAKDFETTIVSQRSCVVNVPGANADGLHVSDQDTASGRSLPVHICTGSEDRRSQARTKPRSCGYEGAGGPIDRFRRQRVDSRRSSLWIAR
jgi:hypothetical protein